MVNIRQANFDRERNHAPFQKNKYGSKHSDFGYRRGTQDLLVWTEGEPLENALQCILPSPTVMIARKINQATRDRKAIFLTGPLMGGGSSTQAVRDHLTAGLPVYAQSKAALTIRDDLNQVAQMGIRISRLGPGRSHRNRIR